MYFIIIPYHCHVHPLLCCSLLEVPIWLPHRSRHWSYVHTCSRWKKEGTVFKLIIILDVCVKEIFHIIRIYRIFVNNKSCANKIKHCLQGYSLITLRLFFVLLLHQPSGVFTLVYSLPPSLTFFQGLTYSELRTFVIVASQAGFTEAG